MSFLGQIFLYVGVVAILVGYLSICFCGFSISFGRGLLTFLFPFIGLGTAIRRFPWMIWLWGGGILAVAIGGILT